MRHIIVLPLFLALLYSVPVLACTTFAVKDGRGDIAFVGKSYDWGTQAAMVVANMKGITKKAFPVSSGLFDKNKTYTPIKWQSQFTSITFAQYSRDIPISGMNDQGLVVETMELDMGHDYGYVPEDATQYISSIQWVQYILDNFATVEDFLNETKDYAIVSLTIYAHYLVCDPTQCVSVEFGTPDNNTGAVPLTITPQGGLPDNPFIASANDYVSCSFQGGVNTDDNNGRYYPSDLLSLKDYAGFGGTRLIPSGMDHCENIPETVICTQEQIKEKECHKMGCDYACRLPSNSWYGSDSVERFVRAAAGSNALSVEARSGKNATADDIFQVLNTVFEEGTITGGAKWQAAYDMRNKKIYWRTVADGCSLAAGFAGEPRSVGFDDFDFGTGECMIPDNTKVVNIDQAPACNGTLEKTDCMPTPSETCNPIPSLPTCAGSDCTISDYDESYNQQLVRFASEKTWIHRNLNGLTGMVKDYIAVMENKKPEDIDDETATAVMYNIWGGYPRGFTACGPDVPAEDTVNLYLWSLLDPYINPSIQAIGNLSVDKKGTYASADPAGVHFAIDYHAEGSASGMQRATMNRFEIIKNGNADYASMEVAIPEVDVPASNDKNELSVDLTAVAGKFTQHLGTLYLGAKLSNTDVKFDVTGAQVSDDVSCSLIFHDPKIDSVKTTSAVEVEKCRFSADPILTATFLVDLALTNPPLAVVVGAALIVLDADATPICKAVASAAGDEILSSAVTDELNQKVISRLPKECPPVMKPLTPATLAAGWGGLEGQYVTARAGHTYVLDGAVTADRDSDDYEFATFSEATPGSGDLLRIDTVRMRSLEGGNKISTLWTPSSEGDRDLFFDIFHWNEPIEEVSPAVLHVRVLPAGGPSSWLGMTNEALSTKLKEVK